MSDHWSKKKMWGPEQYVVVNGSGKEVSHLYKTVDAAKDIAKKRESQGRKDGPFNVKTVK